MNKALQALFAEHGAAWRHPAQATSLWRDAGPVAAESLRGKASGDFWGILDERRITLLISREYENILMGMTVLGGQPHITYWPAPHPSGIAVDREAQRVMIALTRNPNQIMTFQPIAGAHSRSDRHATPRNDRPLVPTTTFFYPGCLYLHDLAFIDGGLHGNAVGMNAVVRFDEAGGYAPVWWPACIEGSAGPDFSRNYLQLNSIAAGNSLDDCFFSASTDAISNRRPGHRNFKVDGRGVIFNGASRNVCGRGLTRPHSARLHDGRVWVNNSGYGELGVMNNGAFEAKAHMPGWTRGLCFNGNLAVVATSRILPRFEQYAPGLKPSRSCCGVHFVDTANGAIVGGYTWPRGNQIFAVEAMARDATTGFALPVGRQSKHRSESLFYSFTLHGIQQSET